MGTGEGGKERRKGGRKHQANKTLHLEFLWKQEVDSGVRVVRGKWGSSKGGKASGLRGLKPVNMWQLSGRAISWPLAVLSCHKAGGPGHPPWDGWAHSLEAALSWMSVNSSPHESIHHSPVFWSGLPISTATPCPGVLWYAVGQVLFLGLSADFTSTKEREREWSHRSQNMSVMFIFSP